MSSRGDLVGTGPNSGLYLPRPVPFDDKDLSTYLSDELLSLGGILNGVLQGGAFPPQSELPVRWRAGMMVYFPNALPDTYADSSQVIIRSAGVWLYTKDKWYKIIDDPSSVIDSTFVYRTTTTSDQPAVPATGSGTPPGWSDVPTRKVDKGDYIWASPLIEFDENTHIKAWGTPVIWSAGVTDGVDGVDGAAGAAGKYVEYRYLAYTSETPVITNPSAQIPKTDDVTWTEELATTDASVGKVYIYQTSAIKSGDEDLILRDWTTPVRFSSPETTTLLRAWAVGESWEDTYPSFSPGAAGLPGTGWESLTNTNQPPFTREYPVWVTDRLAWPDGTAQTIWTTPARWNSEQGVDGQPGKDGEDGLEGAPGVNGTQIETWFLATTQVQPEPPEAYPPQGGWISTTPITTSPVWSSFIRVDVEGEAVSDWSYPVKITGSDGTGVTIKGSRPYLSIIQITDADIGDTYISTSDNTSPDVSVGDGFTWDGTDWVDVGPLQGPAGPTGGTGPAGAKGDKGDPGVQGDQGVQGSAGSDGQTTYFHVAYADTANGGGFSQLPTNKLYIGTYVDFSPTDSTDTTKYSWVLVKGSDGENGENGIAGTNGIDGKTSYLHIAYATNSDGTTGFSTTVSEGKTYIGQYTDFTLADSTTPSKYSWTLIKGEDGSDGVNGEQGVPGTNGTDGVTLYTWVKYSAFADGTNLTDNPTSTTVYIGLAYNKTTPTESTDKTLYTWSKYVGDQGVAGGAGADGVTYYTWIKYSNSANGANMTDNPVGQRYIGLAYNKTTPTESTVATDYTWSQYRGDDGEDGVNGSNGTNGSNGSDGSDGKDGADGTNGVPLVSVFVTPFYNSLDNYIIRNAAYTLKPSYLNLVSTSNDTSLQYSGAISVSGAENPLVTFRIRNNGAEFSSVYQIYYTTASHGITSSYYKLVGPVTYPSGEWVTFSEDMSELTNGGTDWTDSIITGIRVDPLNLFGRDVDLDFISIGHVGSTEDGVRGTLNVSAATNGTSWNATEASNAIKNAGDGNLYVWDTVNLYRTASQYSETRYYNGGNSAATSGWSVLQNFIDGDVIVTGTVGVNQIAANAITTDKLAAGAVTATKITAGTITGDKVNAGTTVTIGGSGAGVAANEVIVLSGTSTSSRLWIGNTNSASANFRVDPNGNMYARNATFAGNVTSTATITGGTINGAQINSANGKFTVNAAGVMTCTDAVITGNSTIGGDVDILGNIYARNLDTNPSEVEIVNFNFGYGSSTTQVHTSPVRYTLPEADFKRIVYISVVGFNLANLDSVVDISNLYPSYIKNTLTVFNDGDEVADFKQAVKQEGFDAGDDSNTSIEGIFFANSKFNPPMIGPPSGYSTRGVRIRADSSEAERTFAVSRRYISAGTSGRANVLPMESVGISFQSILDPTI